MRKAVSKFSRLCDADREDMAQEIRIALFTRGGKGPWLVARHCAIDWWRHAWGRKGHHIGYMQREIPFEILRNSETDEEGDIDVRAPDTVDPLEIRDLDRWLETVGERDAEFLVLYYGHGFNQREIAERVGGITDKGVWWTMGKSLKKLFATRSRSLAERPRTSA